MSFLSNQTNKSVAVLHIALSKSWRGGEQQVFYLMEELAQQKHVHSLLAAHKKSVIRQKALDKNLAVVAHATANPFDPSFLLFLKKQIKEHQINILHAHDARAHIAAVLLADLFKVNIPIVAARRVDFALKKKWFTQHKYNHHQVKRVVCVSHKIQEIIEPTIREKEKVTTIHSGVDLDKFAKQPKNILRTAYKIPANKKLIGTVGALVGHKDHRTFVNAAEIILQSQPDCHFIIIGEGARRAEIEAQIQEKNLNKHITLTGFREDVPQVLPELDLFLFTSNKEGLGTSVIDALAAQLPIVATNAGGIPEIIEDGKSGLLIEKENPTALAKACLSILDDETLQANLIEQAKERATVFSKQKTAEKTLALYRELLN